MSSTLLLPLSPLALCPVKACGLKEGPRRLSRTYKSVGPTPSSSAHLWYRVSFAVRPPFGRSARNQP
eukprot:2007079-Pyramimonas_sp.AAC.1